VENTLKITPSQKRDIRYKKNRHFFLEMKKLLTMILFPFLIIPFAANANENFSVEIEALTLVMEQYKEDSELDIELDLNDKKPSYLALKQDECNATVEVTEKTGIEIVNTEIFDVNVCKKEIYKIVN
jgi:hypothetical protein